MKVETVSVESMDLSYEVPTPGISICEFTEGIQKIFNDKSGKTTLRLPLSIAEVVDGSEDNEGRKFSHFLPIQTAYGEKQLQGILSMVGLLESFTKKFPGEIDPLEDVFLVTLQTKLVGKTIKVVHELRKDQKNKDQVNVIRFEKITNSGVGKPPLKPSEKKVKTQAENEDW